MGSESDLVNLREKVRTESTYSNHFNGQDIPIKKVAAIAAGLVYNDNITSFELYCKYIYNILYARI